MKKILPILLMFILLLINIKVKAMSYYSSYGEFGEYTSDYRESDDTRICEVERRYHWYQEEIQGNYYLLNNNDSKYPNVDLTNSYKTDYTGWQNDVPSDIPQRETYTRYIYETKEMKKIHYISISNVWGNFDYFRISELQILANNQNIDYTIQCNGCNSVFDNYIHNNIVKENMSYLTNGGSLIADLQGDYDASSISIKISLYDVGPNDMRYTIRYASAISSNSPIYLENTFSENVVCDTLNAITIREKTITNLNIVSPEWNEPVIYLAPQEITPTRSVTISKQYQYRDTYFYYYNIVKSYLDGYYLNYDNYQKDSLQYQDYHRCKTRDKVTIDDNIVITNYDQTLDDFINDNTTNNYQIEGNINYQVNGTYHIVYKLPFMDIERDVIVNNPSNNIDELLSEISTLEQQLSNVYLSLNEQISLNENNINIINELNSQKATLLGEINNLNGKLINTINELDQLALTNQNDQNLINSLVQTKLQLEGKIISLTTDVNNLKNELTNLEIMNIRYLESINQLISEKDSLINQLNDLISFVEYLNRNHNKELEAQEEWINTLINNREELENNINALNEQLNNQLEVNNSNSLMIDDLNQEIATLSEQLTNQNLIFDQLQIYIDSVTNLNKTIIKQNHDIKEIIGLKKEEANKYEQEIMRLNLLLTNKEKELKTLQETSKENVNLETPVSTNGFSIDPINAIILILIIIFLVLLKIIYKKNVELK